MDIKIALTGTNSSLFLNYCGTEIKKVTINGADIPAEDVFTAHSIKIPQKNQVVGDNTVQIYFRNLYSTGGNGLRFFRDPEDGKAYVATNLAYTGASHVFPCFDQPGLKASLRLATITPDTWVVASNDSEAIIENKRQSVLPRLCELGIPTQLATALGDSCTLRVFNQTERLSTYTYVVAAGEYKVYESKYDVPGMAPLRLFVRQSLSRVAVKFAPFVIEAFLKGAKYFQQLFYSRFPYPKHDQVFFPAVSGLHSSAGAAVCDDKCLLRDDLSPSAILALAQLTLEMQARAWLGGNVSVRWWNSHWLHEGLCTFLCALCMSQAQGLEEFREVCWGKFCRKTGKALRLDRELDCEVLTDEEAEEMKGEEWQYRAGGVMRQLCSAMGEKAFKATLVEYARKYKGKAVEAADFLGCVKTIVGRQKPKDFKLDVWVTAWLKTAGTSTLSAGDILSAQESVVVTQTGPTRPHRFDVVFFDDKLAETVVADVLLSETNVAVPFPAAVMPKPTAVLVNAGGKDFTRVHIDPTSLSVFQKSLGEIKSPLTRCMVWLAVRTMAEDAVISAKFVVDMWIAHLAKESVNEVFELALKCMEAVVRECVPTDLERRYESERIFDLLRERAKNEKDPELKRTAIEHMAELAAGSQQVSVLRDFLPGLKDQWLRYVILRRQFADPAISAKEKTALLDSEHDPSFEHLKAKHRCEGALSDPEIRARLWKTFVDSGRKESEELVIRAMRGFGGEGFEKEFFASVRNVHDKSVG